MLWIFVGLCGSNLSSGLELYARTRPFGKGKSGGPKPSKPKDSAKVVELRSPILSGNLLILITLQYARTLAIPYISLYPHVGSFLFYRMVVVIWAIVGHCGMLHCHGHTVFWCILILYVELYWCILYMFWTSQGSAGGLGCPGYSRHVHFIESFGARRLMTNRKKKSLARRCERIATCDVVWKGASGSSTSWHFYAFFIFLV